MQHSDIRRYTVPAARNQLVTSMAELPRYVLEPGLSPSNAELAQLAAACSQSLARRIGQAQIANR